MNAIPPSSLYWRPPPPTIQEPISSIPPNLRGPGDDMSHISCRRILEIIYMCTRFLKYMVMIHHLEYFTLIYLLDLYTGSLDDLSLIKL